MPFIYHIAIELPSYVIVLYESFVYFLFFEMFFLLKTIMEAILIL